MIGFPVVFPMLAGLVLAALCWLFFGAGRHAFSWIAPPPEPDRRCGQAMRSTVLAPTPSGERIEAWLYRPPGPPAPLILMAPGLCGTKEGPLERFAEGFAGLGYAVLAFDFRSFGGSEGALRHSTDLRAHVADYRALIAHVREGRVAGVDASRLVLWGTSFSGASAVCAAALDRVEAVILHVPYLGRPGVEPGLIQMLGYIGLAFCEIAGNALAGLIGVKLPPAYITAYCRPGERAFAPSRDGISRHTGQSPHPFWKTLPKTCRGGWRNLMLARDLQHLGAIDPAAALRELCCPVLIIAARRDDMIAIGDTRQIAAQAPCARLSEIEAGHFDPYVDPCFGPNLALQAEFLREALAQDPAPAPARIEPQCQLQPQLQPQLEPKTGTGVSGPGG